MIRYQPPIRPTAEKLKICKAVIGYAQVMGGGFTRDIECGKEFRGGPMRKYCDEHSAKVKYTGRS